jgi:hypothetical protein
MMNEIYIPALSKGHAVNLLQSKGLVFRELCDRVTQDTRIQVIYIYMVPPPKPMHPLILLLFTVNSTYFGTNFSKAKNWSMECAKLKNWKSEKLKNWKSKFSGTMLTSEIFTRIQFFSFSVLFPIIYLENWKTEKLNSQVLCWPQISSPEFSFSVFQFSSFSVLFPIMYLEKWKTETLNSQVLFWPQKSSPEFSFSVFQFCSPSCT